MATTAHSAARQELSARAGLTTPEAASFSTTTNITTNNSVISTGLPNAGYTTDDYFNNRWWIIITGTANASVVRRITDYAQSTGTLTVSGAALAAESGSVTFELHQANPTLLRRVLNDASREAYPALHRRVVDESIFTSNLVRRYLLPSPWGASGVDDATRRLRQVRLFRSPTATNYAETILSNGGFETWTSSSACTGWTATTLTLAREEKATLNNYAVLSDSYSAKCTAPSSAVGDLTQTISSPATYDGRSFAFSVWVYCTTASRVKARITVNSTETESATHNGTGWERLVVQAEASVALTTLKFGVAVTSGTAIIFYADEAIALAGPYFVPDDGGEPLRGWRIEEQKAASPGLPAGVYLTFPYTLPDKHQLRLIGTDYLTQFTATETDTIEIGTPHTEILYAHALRRLAAAGVGGDVAWDRVGAEAANAIELFTRMHKMQLPPYTGLPYDLGR